MEYLKQWSKPREDMECDDLKVGLNLEYITSLYFIGSLS